MIFGEFEYSNPLESIQAFDGPELDRALALLQSKCSNGFWLGYLRYEAWKFLDSANHLRSEFPILYFQQFKNRQKITIPQSLHLAYPKLETTLTQNLYSQKIRAIKNAIKRGDSYQINYTYPIWVSSHAYPKDLFFELANHQNTPFKAFLSTPYEDILCFSPELFFRIQDNFILTQPMKGTAARHIDPTQDSKIKEWLRNDPKNRAENIMIVDLLRNDLSKICSRIDCQNLFEILTLPSVHQMVSTIGGELKNPICLKDIITALFPCGSVTGAPKLKTLEIIQSLEDSERGIYCGMIGVMHQNFMEFCVPIRTLVHKKSKKQSAPRIYTLHIGSGITWDSQATEEYQETLMKSSFTQKWRDFKLVETLLTKNQRIKNLSQHIQRLQKSARYFNFPLPKNLKNLFISFLRDQPFSTQPHILRTTLDSTGNIDFTYTPLFPHQNSQIDIHPIALDSHNDFLYHKTTHAPWYQDSRSKIQNHEIFDTLFFNETGYLTEGSRSNIVISLEDKLLTPPLHHGLLNGILRQKLIKLGKITEHPLRPTDLLRAQKIFCINSLRGMVEVSLSQQAQEFLSSYPSTLPMPNTPTQLNSTQSGSTDTLLSKPPFQKNLALNPVFHPSTISNLSITKSKRVLFLDHYDSFSHNLIHYLKNLGAQVELYTPSNLDYKKIDSCTHILLSPGYGHPKDAHTGLKLLAQCYRQKPILGICLGHQIIAHFFGSQVIHLDPKHGKVFSITHNDSTLLSSLPQNFKVNRYHSLGLKRLKSPLKPCAYSEDGVIMALEHESLPIFGLQYHPESILSQYGYEVLARFLTLSISPS